MSTPPGSIQAVRVVVVGATGRMGSRLCALAHADARFVLAGALAGRASARAGAPAAAPSARGPAPNIEISAENLRDCAVDVVIDFSSDSGAQSALALAKQRRAALLIGTTALSAETRDMLREGAKEISVLLAPNTSLGVAAVAMAVRELAGVLKNFHCSIVEAHHIAKKDAPSGTALRLAEAARAGGSALGDDQVVSIRGGDVIGEHTVRFAGAGEYVELVHRATSRDLFVQGALTAAAWLKGRAPGMYTMEDVLEIGAR